LAAFYDKSSHSSTQLTKLAYWFWFFIYWSAWTSLLTIPWALYQLFKQPKRESFSKQLIDIVIVQTNLVSGVVFCAGGFSLTFPKNPWKLINYLPLAFFGGKVYKIFPWFLYNFFWHVLAPALVVYYWWNYCRLDRLITKKKKLFFSNLISPTIYFIYVLVRPQINIISGNEKNKIPYKYPYDYPYVPFYWCAGKQSSPTDNRFRFCGNQVTKIWQTRLLWILITVSFWYLVFSLLLYFLIKIKQKWTEKYKHSRIIMKQRKLG
jgi:hypothetical protein